MPNLEFAVAGQAETAARTSVQAREFSIIVDEPPTLGGDNLGATPVEYLLAGFAGCLNVVGHLAAKDLNFEIKALKIEVSGPLDPARFLGDPTGPRAGFQSISAKLHLDADIDEATRANWLANLEARCPISDNLSAPTPLKIEVAQFSSAQKEGVLVTNSFLS